MFVKSLTCADLGQELGCGGEQGRPTFHSPQSHSPPDGHGHNERGFLSLSQSVHGYFFKHLLCTRHGGYCDDNLGGETKTEENKSMINLDIEKCDEMRKTGACDREGGVSPGCWRRALETYMLTWRQPWEDLGNTELVGRARPGIM